MSDQYTHERQEVLDAVQRIVAARLVAGASGNVSRRIRAGNIDGDREGDRAGGLFAITASRVPYYRFTLEDVLVVDFDVEPIVGDGIPSSESLLHMAIYRARPDVGAVIHTHSVHASAFAVAGQPLPAILDEQVVTLGGAIEVAQYGASASEDLADKAVFALGDRAAVLLRHHGVAAVGETLEEAVAAAELVERIAQIRAITIAIGAPQELDAEVVRAEQKVYRMLKGMR